MYQQDRYAELAEAAERTLEAATGLGDPEVIADATWQVARAIGLRGRLPEAAERYRRTVRDARRLGLSDRALVYGLTGLANAHAELGETAAAAHHYQQALDHHRAADRTRVVILLRFAEALSDADADADADKGEGEGGTAEGGRRALDLLTEAERIVAGIDDEVGAAHVERARGLVDLGRRDWSRARARLLPVLATLRAHRETLGVTHVLRSLGDAAIGARQAGTARRYLHEGRALCGPMGAPVETARVEARLAVAYRLSGEFGPADEHTAAYRGTLAGLGLPPACLRLPAHVRRLLPPTGTDAGPDAGPLIGPDAGPLTEPAARPVKPPQPVPSPQPVKPPHQSQNPQNQNA
jgi:tetratricopeptide (TPR) repeat protein